MQKYLAQVWLSILFIQQFMLNNTNVANNPATLAAIIGLIVIIAIQEFFNVKAEQKAYEQHLQKQIEELKLTINSYSKKLEELDEIKSYLLAIKTGVQMKTSFNNAGASGNNNNTPRF